MVDCLSLTVATAVELSERPMMDDPQTGGRDDYVIDFGLILL